MSSASVTTSSGQTVVTSSDDGDSVTTVTPATPATPATTATPGGRLTSTGDFTVGIHSDKPLDGASFTAGLLLGALLYFIIQTALRWHARREARGHARAAAIGPQAHDRTASDIAALARRTAALETIVTDPAQRTARAIDALR